MRCLPPGITIGLWPTGVKMAFQRIGVRQRTCKPWSLAIVGKILAPGWYLRVIRPPGEVSVWRVPRQCQGEDVVAGIRDPQPIHALEELMPEVYAELVKVCQTLEEHFRDMQDIEFTIQNRTLYLLQTRSGKRTAPAAVRGGGDGA